MSKFEKAPFQYKLLRNIHIHILSRNIHVYMYTRTLSLITTISERIKFGTIRKNKKNKTPKPL